MRMAIDATRAHDNLDRPERWERRYKYKSRDRHDLAYYTHRVRESAVREYGQFAGRTSDRVSSCLRLVYSCAVHGRCYGSEVPGAVHRQPGEPTPDRPRRTGMADTSHDSADMPLYAPLCTGLYLRFTTSVRCPSPRALYTYRSAAPCAVPAYMYGPRSRVRIRHSPKKSRPRAAPAAVWDRSRWM